METDIQVREENIGLMTKENLQNASALLALMHGKSDSICRLFKKEIFIQKSDLKTLNDMMVTKLSLHNVSAITTSLDITFTNKRVVTFKSWLEFEIYDFSTINAETKSIFIQWDFLALINNYQVPQRHTVSIRISSSPHPSDFFKVLLSGGFDEAHNLDIQSSTMLCKVDFVNNTLAEELVNVAEHWNSLCECAYSKKGILKPFLAIHRNGCAHIFEICLILSLMLIVAISVKLCIQKDILTLTNEFLLYALMAIVPVAELVKRIANAGAKKIYNAFSDLMDTHIFKISKGDDKEIERIEKASKVGKELTLFLVNAAFSIILSVIFFLLG